MGTLTAYALRHRAIVLVLLGALYLRRRRRLSAAADRGLSGRHECQVQIITLFPGHAAEEVERLVTIPIENQMNGIPKRASMRSISMFGLSQVTIVFDDDADGDLCAQSGLPGARRRESARPAPTPAFRRTPRRSGKSSATPSQRRKGFRPWS